MIFSQEDERRLSEAAAKAVTSIAEAVEGIASAAKACGVYVCEMVSAFSSFWDQIKKCIQPTDEELREVATGKENHLMMNAKKGRTRKKYRNRLTKRYHDKTSTERSIKA